MKNKLMKDGKNGHFGSLVIISSIIPQNMIANNTESSPDNSVNTEIVSDVNDSPGETYVVDDVSLTKKQVQKILTKFVKQGYEVTVGQIPTNKETIKKIKDGKYLIVNAVSKTQTGATFHVGQKVKTQLNGNRAKKVITMYQVLSNNNVEAVSIVCF